MSLSIDEVFSLLSKSLMLLGTRGSVVWESETEDGKTTRVNLTLAELVIRSFGEQLVEDGYDMAAIKAALEKLDAEEKEFPNGEPYSVMFKSLGGSRRKTHRKTG